MLSKKQSKQINSQIKAYENQANLGIQRFNIGKKTFNLEIDSFVANPKIMNSSIQLFNYLVSKPELFRGKTVTDIGTGSGILGITCALLGAKKVYMSDIDKKAVENAERNVKKLKLEKICKVIKSDLFKNFQKHQKADIQIFNHPYFPEKPAKGKEWTQMMLGGTGLIGAYFKHAPKYSNKDATYILSWFEVASSKKGLDNDPKKRAPEYGFNVLKSTEQKPVKQGLQKDKFTIFEFRFIRKNNK